MSGPDDVTVVWIEKAEGRDDASRALVDWGRARGVRPVLATTEAGAGETRLDFGLGERVEKELDRAREASAALDADAAERALARADTILREHPELPHAAWLRAEVHRGWAVRWARIEPRDEGRAQLAWQDADALGNGRVAGIGEIAYPKRPPVATALTVHGSGGRGAVVARLDGVPLTAVVRGDAIAYPISVPPGEHHVLISLGGATVFASWVAISSLPAGIAQPAIPIHIGDDGACSALSFAAVRRDDDEVRAANVSCERWIAVAPGPRRGAVLVARCARDACAPFLEWRSEASLGDSPDKLPPPATGGRWPAWATWTAIGVGAAAATTITLIASGVFEARPTERRFVAGGVRNE